MGMEAGKERHGVKRWKIGMGMEAGKERHGEPEDTFH